ncbi:uncharacterized protein C11orf65 homolog [Rhinatrema bivittatum]|uniref:uncharacterized protein C11orf65 homolog n=1 Tax=Rhinatrema bivittatum TaxID=194408 RepID=UPI0011283363|nr:uncharacterized protein C11orf65 homolog [Rhinatrema bivittatum]XP_029458328.1 uncharacterized protein C11orf65 homolog [Rhinatrema bivittatum]
MDDTEYLTNLKKAKEETAARIIQRAWRRHIDILVFEYYKNMINLHRQGDPRILLKCVNPREAELVDAAVGVHIRFRLGGIKFPPNIYYKIFTHRPIADICAISPKNHMDQAAKQLLPKQLHNRVAIPKLDFKGWYKRKENNGWRPIFQKLLSTVDIASAAQSNKNLKFHYSKLKRKQDVKDKQKKRKIEWMKKMYYEGSLHAQAEDPNTADLIQRATEGIISTVERNGSGKVMDWEVDELLKWTNALNFEEYTCTWNETGVSNSSSAWKDSSILAPVLTTGTRKDITHNVKQTS